jgi:hypothetical protein
VAAVEVGHNMVFSLSELDMFIKLGLMEVIFPKKQARFKLNTSQFSKKCSLSPIWPELQNLHKRSEAGIGGDEYLNF